MESPVWIDTWSTTEQRALCWSHALRNARIDPASNPQTSAQAPSSVDRNLEVWSYALLSSDSHSVSESPIQMRWPLMCGRAATPLYYSCLGCSRLMTSVWLLSPKVCWGQVSPLLNWSKCLISRSWRCLIWFVFLRDRCEIYVVKPFCMFLGPYRNLSWDRFSTRQSVTTQHQTSTLRIDPQTFTSCTSIYWPLLLSKQEVSKFTLYISLWIMWMSTVSKFKAVWP